jgi:glutathione S-transferase
MQLYGRRSSINVQKVIWCFAELGLAEARDYQRIDAGLEFGVVDTPSYRALNPNGLVPTLVDGDLVIWESNTILRYLAARQHDAALLPTQPGERAEVERWMDWQLGTLWATLRVAFLGLTRTPPAQRNPQTIDASLGETARLLRLLDARLDGRPFVAAGRFTLADIVLGLSVHRWYGLAERFPERPAFDLATPEVARWLAQMRSRAGWIEATRV